MPQLDHLIDQWAKTLKASEPRLEEHLEEIRDHVRTDAQMRIDAGADASNAFAAAVGAFGAPRDVAREFLMSAMSARTLAVRFAGACLGAAIVLTTAVIVIDNYFPLDVMWVGIGLTAIMMLPVIAIPFYLERSSIELWGELPVNGPTSSARK